MVRRLVMADPHTVAVVVQGPDGPPLRIDVALTVRDLADDDVLRPGDTLISAAVGRPTTPEDAEDIGCVLALVVRSIVTGVHPGRGGAV